MDAADRELSFLAESVERTARVQRDAAATYLDSAPRHGVALARHLKGAYDALIAHVQGRRQEFEALPDSEAQQGALTEMRQLVSGARSLHESLSWLDAAAAPPLDLGTRYLVEQMARHLVAPNAEITVVTTTDRSYATVTNPLSQVFALAETEPSMDDALAIVIFVPRREQDSGLLHPLMIHELAHAATARHQLVDGVLDRGGSDPAIERALTEAAEADETSSEEEREAIIDTLRERLARWVEETVCDSVAAALLGPTYLYSFVAVVGTSDLDTAGEDHPSTRQRIRVLLEILDDLGWKETLAGTSEEIDSWCRVTAAKDVIDSDPAARFCANALAQLGDHVCAVVNEHVDDRRLSPDAFREVSDEIDDLLTTGIPPAQRFDDSPIDRAAIILGSWIFAMHEEGGGLAALATAPDVPQLSRLLPKALQSAELLEAWVREKNEAKVS
jgi:hypothetical protein